MVRSGWIFLGVGTLTSMLAVWSSLAGCQDTGTSAAAGPSGPGGEGPGGSGTGGTVGTSTSNGGAGGTMGPGGAGGSGTGGAVACDPTGTTDIVIKDFLAPKDPNDPASSPKVGPGVAVHLKGVAMSKLFLISKSKAGSCLWGAFISDLNLAETAPYTGTLALSYGKGAVIPTGGTESVCPGSDGMEASGSAIPDNVKPGDVLDLIGKTGSYKPSTCGQKPGETSVPEYQITNVKCATSVPGSALPKPHVMKDTELAQLASPTDKAFHDMWGGVRVRVENVDVQLYSATPDAGVDAGTPGTVVGPYGIIQLAGGPLNVDDKLYYVKNSMNMCETGPIYIKDPLVTTFKSIEGFSYLNYCTWDLSPTSKCADFDPPSEDCNGNPMACP